MNARIASEVLVVMFVLALPANAGEKGPLNKYFSDVAQKVKATGNAWEKRQILDGSFQTMSSALDMAKGSMFVSKEDGIAIDRLKAAVKEKQDELTGTNGYIRVSDEQLNAFSDYVVQDTEQAELFITISVVTLLLLLILIVLLAK